MQVVILAAGRGTRLRPLTANRPKSMVHVAGEPLIHHLLRDLGELGFQEAVLVVGHGSDHLRQYVGDGDKHGLHVTFVQQDKQLGAGHALHSARDAIDDEDVFVLPADAWYSRSALERLRDAPAPAMLVVHDPRSRRHGVPHLDRGQVRTLTFDGQDVPLASGGVYRLPRSLIDTLPDHAFRLGQAVAAALEDGGPWNAVDSAESEYVDVVEPADLLELSSRLLRGIDHGIHGTVEEGAVLQGTVCVGEGTVIRAGCVIRGPVHIGSHCDIGPLAHVGPNTSVRNHVRVAAFTDLSDCLIASNVNISGHSRVRNAILDLGAHIGTGAALVADDPIVVGADAHLGHNVAIEEGARVGVEARIRSGRSAGDVPDGGVAV